MNDRRYTAVPNFILKTIFTYRLIFIYKKMFSILGMLMYLVYLVVGGITRLYRTASGYGGINNHPDLESARNVLNENLKQDD